MDQIRVMQMIRATKAGTQFVKLTMNEVRAIADLACTVIARSRAGGSEMMIAVMILRGLVRKQDFVIDLINELERLCGLLDIPIHDILQNPNTAKEQYRGLNEEQRHVLRRFKHASAIRDSALAHGLNLDDLDIDPILYTETDEIGDLIRLNRDAEARKRATQRQQSKIDHAEAKVRIVSDTMSIRARREVRLQQLTRQLTRERRRAQTFENLIRAHNIPIPADVGGPE